MVQTPKPRCRRPSLTMATAAQLLLLCATVWSAGHAAEADEREEPAVAASSKVGVDLVPAATTHSVGYGHHLHPFYFQGGIDEQRRYSCALQGEWKPIVHDSGGYLAGHSSYGPSGDPSLHHHHHHNHHHQDHHQPQHDDGLEAAGLELHAAAADASGAAYLLPPPAPSAQRPRQPPPPPPPPPPQPQPSPAAPPHSQNHQSLPQALPLLGKGKPAPGKVRGRPLPPPPLHKGKYRKQPFGPKPYGGVPLKLTPVKGGDLNGRLHPYHNYIPIGRPLPHNHKYSPQDLRGGAGNGVGGEQYPGTSSSPAPVYESSSSVSGDVQAPPSGVAGGDGLVADVVGDAGLLPAHPHLNLLHPPEAALVPQVHLVAAGAPVQAVTPPQLFQHLQQLQVQQQQLQNQQNLQAEQQLQAQYHRQAQQQLQAQAQQQLQAQAQQQFQAQAQQQHIIQAQQQQQLQAQQHLQVQVGGAGSAPLPPAQALTAPQPSQAQQGFVVHVQQQAQQPFPGHALDLNAQAQQEAYAQQQAQQHAQHQAQQHAQHQAQQHAQQQAQQHAQQQAQQHAQQQAQQHAQQQAQQHTQQQAQHQAQQHAQQQGQAHVQQIGQHVEVTIQESQSVQLDSQPQGTQHQLLVVGSHVGGGGGGNAGGHVGHHVVGGHVGGELLSCTASGHYQVQDALPAASEDQAVAGSVLYEALDLGQEQQQHLVAVGTPRGRALPASPPRAPHDTAPAAAAPVASVAAAPAWRPPPSNFQRGPNNANGRRAKNYHGPRPGPVPVPLHGHTHGARFHRPPPPPPPTPTRYNALAHGRYAPQYPGPHKNARVMYVPYGGYGDMYAP